MLILRIRRAEVALADGRLDEAFETALAGDIQEHRRGQRLINELTKALVARGKDHFEGDRMSQAMADCEKAQRLGGNQAGVAELKSAIAERLTGHQHVEQGKARAVATAREHIDNGQLSIGEGMLARVEGQGAGILQSEVDRRRALIDKAFDRARAAIGRVDFATAIEAALEIQRHHAPTEAWDGLVAEIRESVLSSVRSAVDRGRIDLAESFLNQLTRLTGTTIDITDLQRFIGLCRKAVGCIEGGEPRQAAQLLRQLRSIRPEAGWIDAALQNVQKAAEHLEEFRSGPLGLLMHPQSGHAVEETQVIVNEPSNQREEQPAPRERAPLPACFLLQVDGIGSYLVLRNPRVTVGPVSSSARPDVGLLIDASVPIVTLERIESDYFLTGDHELSVNDSLTNHKLLADGDKIALSPRCRFRFNLPHAASSSAVLNFSGMRMPRGDARRAIMLDRELVIGPGSSSHIRADQLEEPVVLYVRNDRLYCRSKQEALVGDRPVDRNAGISLDSNVRIGSVSFVVTEV